MNAKEARDLTLSVKDGESKKQYDEIQSNIEKASLAGEFRTHFYFSPTTAVLKKLEHDGFLVNSLSSRNETIYQVNWKDEQL